MRVRLEPEELKKIFQILKHLEKADILENVDFIEISDTEINPYFKAR